MKTALELAEDLMKVYESIKPGDDSIVVASGKTHTANVIQKIHMGRLKHKLARKETPDMPFWK